MAASRKRPAFVPSSGAAGGGGGGAPTGSAGGDLGSTYPNPTVVATHLSAALPVAQGGTGAATLTGVLKGNGTSAVTAATNLAVADGGTGAGTLTGLVKGNGTSAMTAVTAPSGAVVGDTDTQTLTNKRINPREQTVSSNATVTPNADTNDFVTITAQAAALTLANPSGTPVQGQEIWVRIKDNGTARAISYGTEYRGIVGALPSTTVISKTMYMRFLRNATDTKWDLVGVAQEP